MIDQIWLYSLSSVFIVSLISLIGIVVLVISGNLLNRIIFILVSLAVGGLLGDAFIHLLPEAFESFDNPLLVYLYAAVGFLVFLVLEKFLHWHHHHDDEEGVHIHPVGYINIISDGLHNFIDGILIGVSYLISLPVGIATTLSVVMHEIPQEIGDFGILIKAGFSRGKALLINFVTAIMAIAGTVLALILGDKAQQFAQIAVPLTAGGFIYIAVIDLLPELYKEKKPHKVLLQTLAIFSGVLIMYGLKVVAD